MRKKRGQTWSLETYLAIGIFLIAFIFFYSLTTLNTARTNIGVEVEEIGRKIMSTPQLEDGTLTNEELMELFNMDCDQLKDMFDTNREICIYIQDSEGNLISNGSHILHGIGCPGINISGMMCGTNST